MVKFVSFAGGIDSDRIRLNLSRPHNYIPIGDRELYVLVFECLGA